MQVVNDLDLELLVNNSWSGSSLLHNRNGTVGAYVDRCIQLHNDNGINPDIIAIQMGTNDFQYYKDTLGTSDIDYDNLIIENQDGIYTYKTPTTSLEAAAIVLHKITVRYPNAEVYYLNLSQRIDGYTELLESFNKGLEEVCNHFNVSIVDIYNSGINQENFNKYIGDNRVHPNALGMDVYTEAFKKAMIENSQYIIDSYNITFDLKDVNVDYGTNKIVNSNSSFNCELTSTNGNRMDVKVIMGENDITEKVYSNGIINIDEVIDDVKIEAYSEYKPRYHYWISTEEGLSSSENPLIKKAGTITNGQYDKVIYQLTDSIVLKHNLSWGIEWKSSGNMKNSDSATGARLFTSTNNNSEYNARYLFKSSVGIIAMGEKTNTGSHNYGLNLNDYGIDSAVEHTYRLENRISNNENMIYLYVDNVEIGAMNHYYIGTKNQNIISDWLSGKDFEFSYMGTDTHGLTNCSIEYMSVWEDNKSLTMQYDDHYDVSGKTVEIIDTGTPTSYQVGYGIDENAVLDTSVITLKDNTLIATGIGNAVVRIDNDIYNIKVETAPISLLLLIGQSNMRGSEGNANQSIVCPDGMVYSSYGDDRGETNTMLTPDNGHKFIPSALTGEYSKVNVEGTTDCLSGYPIDSLTENGQGRMGPDSGFAYEWVKQTGEKVWVVNAAHGGTSITTWINSGTNYKEAVAMFSAAQETLQKEIAAGHYTLSHMGYYWCQGCTDYSKTAEWYVDKYLDMHEDLKNDLSFDHDNDSMTADKTFEFGGIIPVRAGHDYYNGYRQGISEYTTNNKYYESFKDLRMTGPSVAQYWMCNNPELKDIWLVCNAGEDWVWMPDGTNGVANYFNKYYENGIVDYKTQVQQKESWYKPTTPAVMHDSIHYNQIGYNEVGRESVRNTMVYLGINESENIETKVNLVSWEGLPIRNEILADTVGSSKTLVVPKVYPVYKSKDVTNQLSEGYSYVYYDVIKTSNNNEGTLTLSHNNKEISIKSHAWTEWSVIVVPSETTIGKEQRTCEKCGEIETRELKGVWQKYDWINHLSKLPENYCSNTDLWKVLEHDTQYFSNGTNWGTHSSKTVYSITIPVKEGDKIYATSFGKAKENGHNTSNGIRVTWFDEYGVLKTLSTYETYAEFNKNSGYLIAPKNAKYVNIPMWTTSNDNEVFILNAEHVYENGICASCGKLADNLANYKGKVISILGDSISTFAGYIPIDDGFNLTHSAFYPKSTVKTVEQTWWHQLITMLEAKLGVNDSWSGSRVMYSEESLNKTNAMLSTTRIQNLGSNGTPDVILFLAVQMI